MQEDIAKLVGRLRFEADNRPLLAFSRNIQKAQKDMEALAKVANKKLTVRVSVNTGALRADLKRIVSDTSVELNKVGISGKSLQAIRDRIQNTVAKNRINLVLGVNANRLSSQIRSQLRTIMQSIGTINIPSPNIRLKVDRTHLQAEIQSVLQQIQREARIRLDLRGDFGPRPGPRPSPGGGGSRGGAAGSAGLAAAGAHWGRGFVPGLGGAFAVSQLNQINQEMQGQTNAFTAIMGGSEAGAEQQKWVKDLSNEIGMDYRSVAPAYGKMLASGQTAGMSTKSVQNIFQGVSEYGRVMGLDKESMKGSMKAIEQMMNKGQVMSEELKGQLAERMPGAMSAMADAAGFGTDEKGVAKLMDAMQKGQVKSKAVLEKFAAILAERAREGGALEKAKQSTAAQQERMNNAFSDSVKTLADAGFDRATGNFFKDMAKSMEKATPLIKALGSAFEYLMIPVRAVITIIGDLGAHFDELSAFFGTTSDKLTLFSGSVLMSLTPLGRMLQAITVVTLGIEDFITYLEGGESQFGKWMESLAPEQAEKIKQMGWEFKQLATSLRDLGSISLEGLNMLTQMFGKGSAFDGVVENLTRAAAAITNVVDAIKALKNGSVSDALDFAKEAAKETVPYKVIDRNINMFSGNGWTDTPRDIRSISAQREAEAKELRAKQFAEQGPMVVPKPDAQQPQQTTPNAPASPSQLVVSGDLVLQMPNVTGNPTDIEKAVNQVLHKAVRSINSNQTEGEQ